MKNLLRKISAICIVLTLILCVGCIRSATYHETKLSEIKQRESEEKNRIELKLPYNVKIIVIDSCEYILRDGSSDNENLAHKGNCKYCAERALAN